MRPIQHPSNTDVLRAPNGATVDECRPLAITRFQFDDGAAAVRSYWQPTDAERAAIAGGALIEFTALGSTHPPIALGVDGLEAGQ